MPLPVWIIVIALAGIGLAGALWYFVVFPARWYFLYLKRRHPGVSKAVLVRRALRAPNKEINAAIDEASAEERAEISNQVESRWVAIAFLIVIVVWALASIGTAVSVLL